MKNIKLGTRGSKLALWQAVQVADILKNAWPDIAIDIQVVKTTGDKILDVALSKIGDKGLFTKEIEKELIVGRIDIAVHSLKDMPSELESGLCIGAVLERESPQDVLISDYTISNLPEGAVIGTSSLRRIAQLKYMRPDLSIVDIRGNIETRIHKMKQLKLDGIILAYAGVKRLGLEKNISEIIPDSLMLPAVGQGIIAIEMREADCDVANIMMKINHAPTFTAAQAERSFLYTLEGGCQVPMACLAQLKNGRLYIEGLVASLDGRKIFRANREGLIDQALETGRLLAIDLLNLGASKTLDEYKNTLK